MRQKYFFIILGLVIVLIIGFILFENNENTKQTDKDAKSNTPMPKEAIITLDKNGFSPDSVTINVGSTVDGKMQAEKNRRV